MSEPIFDGDLDDVLTPQSAARIGHKQTLHRQRVLIEDGAVVLQTRCGIPSTTEGWTRTYGIPTCDECAKEATSCSP